tara:strand:- start:1002 stop:1274 length:273 start_codon:yes stop_codon:yes gene_type:complete
MKITKSQLIEIIRKELQNERMDAGASPEEIERKRSEINQAASGYRDSRKNDAKLVDEIQSLLVGAKSIRSVNALPDALDKITDLLMKRKG